MTFATYLVIEFVNISIIVNGTAVGIFIKKLNQADILFNTFENLLDD